MVRFSVGQWDVDLFVSKTPYDMVCLQRAAQVEVLGTKVKVVTPEDLLIHKALKLRTDRRRILQDVADLRSLLAARGASIDWAYLKQWLRPAEADLLTSLLTLDDEAVLRRLLATS